MRVREAATVMLVRDGDDGMEVCLLQRNPSVVFVPGAHVFPGGAVDHGDVEATTDPACHRRSGDDACRILGVDGRGLAYWVAAVRECFEEAGVLLARSAGGQPIDTAAHRLVAARQALLAGECTLVELCRQDDLVLALDDMFYVSHWITPRGAPRRYDTRFFVAPLPPGQQVEPDGSEVVADLWARPEDALRLFASGELDLILPTARNLELLAGFETVDGLLAALAEAEGTIDGGSPARIDDAGGWRVPLPGDPDAPAGVAPGAGPAVAAS